MSRRAGNAAGVAGGMISFSARHVSVMAALSLTGAIAAPSASADIANDEMRACAELWPKPPGSVAGRTQARRIAAAFRSAGLATSYEDFHVPLYVVDRVRLAVTGRDAREVPGETFAYGGTGRVQAEVVGVGIGRPADYAGRDVRGKIVMVTRDEAFHRFSQFNEIVAHGGAAMLYVSGSPDNLGQTGSTRPAQAMPAPIPSVTVGADDGAALREQVAGGLSMSIEVDATRRDATARNVIGVRRGTTHPDKVMVVGGHYDNWHHGAIDNCTGVGSLLSVADAVKDAPLAYTVVFAAWDAEEVGLTGSYDWVMRHPDLVDDIVVNENLEMTAAGAGAGAIRFGTTYPAMNALVRQAGEANGYAATELPATVVRQISGGILPTDIQPFYSAGVQGFSTFTSTPFYHTPDDVFEQVDAASLTRASAYLRDALLNLQTAAPADLQRREVPSVDVRAPEAAAAGAPVPVEIRVTDPTGQPIAGAPVRVRVNQNDHWALAEASATDLGDGRYRYTIPAGLTDADRTRITATVDVPAYIAEGYATVDQTRGGLLATPPEPCTSQRVFQLPVRGGLNRLTATITAGQVTVEGDRMVVDLRRAEQLPATLRVSARASGGAAVRQSRQFRACASESAIARAAGGL
jgi:predicted secreted protein